MGRREDMPVGVKFSIVSRAFKTRIDDLMRDSGLTSVQAGVLMALYRLENCGEGKEINQKDLEQAIGFVECAQSTKDKRSKSIRTTEKSRDIHKNMGKTDERVLEEMCKGIDDDRRKLLTETLDAMLDNIFEKEGK